MLNIWEWEYIFLNYERVRDRCLEAKGYPLVLTIVKCLITSCFAFHFEIYKIWYYRKITMAASENICWITRILSCSFYLGITCYGAIIYIHFSNRTRDGISCLWYKTWHIDKAKRKQTWVATSFGHIFELKLEMRVLFFKKKIEVVIYSTLFQLQLECIRKLCRFMQRIVVF